MRVMITGAAGFLGRLLVQRLLDKGQLRGQPLEALVLLDRQLEGFPSDPRLRLLAGSIAEPTLLRRALADGVDVVFHLVSVPGGAAEEHYALGRQVNLLATLELLDQLRNAARPPVLVYASSVAVYGAQLPARMDEQWMPRPALSYGAHKVMVETQLNDLARRGEVDGRALRLPGIVARPREPNGLRSAFMSDLMHALAAGENYCCPVSPQATAWWMSARCCVDNLLHAAELQNPGPQRVWQLPVLHLAMDQVVEALVEAFGDDRRALVSYQPNVDLEALFGRYPPLRTPQSRALGFHHDGSAQTLVRNALSLSQRPRHARASLQTL
ncbi:MULTISPECIES: NAD-dependent epimerase/dehydratase family protein [unclassified Pseudomonas]|uniref:NAD-dependent epimerase/dehydratase family protein n=1 Tax=unclassified Pseudomonas TaxID=196821 RepID=UPI0004009F86|nr:MULTISPECIES: NAD-dependent epimerase/dehydratase family protein [unclassified Pseudomonas]SMF18715.1 Nucleoside-diphosphate-sugar epimerase [Pseudomonas sp. LAIL14HWK12:I11]SMR77324.1 Nucleoside-diphosphate-sugar epimerase [Pseudomonas sp. LAIL14HWK12:I10]SOD02907.1 Nucleoside-diphosphate-sugar epimerase [Pseudomonas sp. LAIL14HWK12:I8]